MTKGLGSGGRPETGKQAAMEDTEHLIESLQGADMVFLTAGLGGGDGDGRDAHPGQPGRRDGYPGHRHRHPALRVRMQVRGWQAEEGLLELRMLWGR